MSLSEGRGPDEGAGQEVPTQGLFVEVQLGAHDLSVSDLEPIVEGQFEREARRRDRKRAAQHQVARVGAAAR